MNARDRIDEIEYRLASPMVTYKENATEDAPALVAALRAVLDRCDELDEQPHGTRWVHVDTLRTFIDFHLGGAS